MEYWTCKICDIQMQMQSREPHLSGKRHAAAAEAYEESIFQATTPREAAKQWTCTICNIEMQMQSRDSHLSGRRHAMATRSQQEEFHLEPGAYIPECNTTTASSSSTKAKVTLANFGVGGITGDTIYSTSDLTEFHGAPAVLVWQCTVCSCYVPLSVKQSHLSSLDHVQRLLEIIKVTSMAIPQPQVQIFNRDLGEKEKLDYQDVVNGTRILAAYLINHTSDKEATAEFPAMNPLLKSMAQFNMKSNPEKRRTAHATGEKARQSFLDLQSTPIPSIGPLDAFFLSFSGYQYDPSLPPAESFRSFRGGLRRWNDWDGRIPDTWKGYEEDIHTRYQAALTKEFNLWFGTEDDMGSWHSLCRAIGIRPLPTTCEESRETVQNRHVNIVDLIQWAREREVGQVQIFETVKELSKYSYEENKIYHKDQLEQGVVLRHLLRHIARERV